MDNLKQVFFMQQSHFMAYLAPFLMGVFCLYRSYLAYTGRVGRSPNKHRTPEEKDEKGRYFHSFLTFLFFGIFGISMGILFLIADYNGSTTNEMVTVIW